MDASEASRLFDELRACIDAGPGPKPAILRRAMGIVNALLAAAPEGLPRATLVLIQDQLPLWFSDLKWRGDEAQLRSDLIQDIDLVRNNWDRPGTHGTTP